jgi:hypothetical protein
MGVVGVWSGSNGPLLYTADDLRLSVPHWNGKPVVVYHPDMKSNGCAGHPQVFNRQRVGHIFNARFDGKALKAEAWLDPERLKVVSPRVLTAVRRGEIMEVSTGLFTEKNQGSGTFNGKQFVATAKNHRPDHLAILPDQTGACSIEMGAGLCRNQRLGEEPPLVAPALLV